jgi:catechol 2,3-dioxygenase-like lactoylglutathione lyase family enzyme
LAFVGRDLHAYVELMHDPDEHPAYQLGDRYGHLAFEVEGPMKDTLDALRAQGVKVLREPRASKSGRLIAFVEDPNGVPIELLESVTPAPAAT